MSSSETTGLWRRFAMLAGLTAMAISQPLLSVLSTSPATFLRYRFEGSDIVAFALVITFVPPLLLWGLGALGHAIDRRLGLWIHTASVAVLFAVFVQQVLVQAGLGSFLAAALLSTVAGGILAFLLVRVDAVATWLALTGVLPLVALALFLFASPVSDLVNPPSAAQPVVTELAEGDDPPPSVVMIVLDELPTQSIVGADGEIDEVRFPNLAGFAEDATWYRHFTTLSPFTESAVPSMLTGVDPDEGDDPLWTNYPDNLFRLLGASHHMTVAEAFTRLCGIEGCTLTPTAPPRTDSDQAPSTDAPPEPDAPSTDRAGLWATVRTILRDRLDPTRSTASILDDFEEATESVDVPSMTTIAPSDTIDPSSSDDLLLRRFTANQFSAQPERYADFLEAFTASNDPTLYFLHLVLPHHPWRIDADGVAYVVPDGSSAPVDPFMRGEWLAKLNRQRHLNQASYTDGLLGGLLHQAQSEGIYDDAIIVVAADHGVAFEPGAHLREFSDSTVESIAYAPLLIKLPGQHEGEIDDANVSSIDILPTIARAVGVEVPWDIDGNDMASNAIDARGTTKRYYDWTDALDAELRGEVEYDDDEVFDELLADLFPSIAADDDRLVGLWKSVPDGRRIIGSSIRDYSLDLDTPITADVSLTERLRNPGDEQPAPGVIAGFLGDGRELIGDDALVIVAVDGSVISLSEIEQRNGQPGWFAAPVPSDHRPPVDFGLFVYEPTTGSIAPMTVS